MTQPPPIARPDTGPQANPPIDLADLTTSTDGAQVIGDELTPADVARECKVSASTVRRWDKRGQLKPTRILPGSNHRRYSREVVDEFRRKLDQGEKIDGASHGDS